jgi:indole-3-glycerol phosphate synthase
MPAPTFIAEVKTASPFGWRSEKSWGELFEIANQYGDWISVHTDPRWDGSFELVAKARKLTDKPILAKGIHADDADIRKALDAGADWLLVVGRAPEVHPEQCLIEVITVADFQTLPAGTKAVWNSRDLATGGPKSETFADARAAWDGWLCQASNIRTPDDVASGADAILVGTHLPEFSIHF